MFMEALAEIIKIKSPGVNVHVYMDDFCITGMSEEIVTLALNDLKEILRSVGFTINE